MPPASKRAKNYKGFRSYPIREERQMFGRESSEYLLKRQRKEILENLGRVAVVGLRNEPIFKSYGLTEKLIDYGVKILPVIPKCESFLGIPCYDELQHIAGEIDIVQVYPETGLNVLKVAQQAIQKGTKVFWIEDSEASEPVRKLLTEAKVYVMEQESPSANIVRTVCRSLVCH